MVVKGDQLTLRSRAMLDKTKYGVENSDPAILPAIQPKGNEARAAPLPREPA